MSFDPAQRATLDQIAWRAIDAGLQGVAGPTIAAALFVSEAPDAAEDTGFLQDKGATFVTILRDGQLRGCIGTTVAHQPLGDDVARHAYAAAFQDPRFGPVQRSEWAALSLEISVLAPPSDLAVHGRGELLRRLRPGVDGLVLRAGNRGATFLPSVWASLSEPARFVDALLAKGGFDRGSWPEGMRVQTYTVEKWRSEPPKFGA